MTDLLQADTLPLPRFSPLSQPSSISSTRRSFQVEIRSDRTLRGSGWLYCTRRGTAKCGYGDEGFSRLRLHDNVSCDGTSCNGNSCSVYHRGIITSLQGDFWVRSEMESNRKSVAKQLLQFSDHFGVLTFPCHPCNFGWHRRAIILIALILCSSGITHHPPTRSGA